MLQFAVGMTIVIATICVLGWFLRRILGSSTSGTGVMKMLAGISVGTRERVVLLQIGNRQMLVGVAPGSVAAIHVFDEPIINHDCSDMPDKVASPFSRILGNLGISGGKQ